MATFAEWVKQFLERQVAEAIAGAGLSGRLYATIEGPQTISLEFQLYNPNNQNIRKALGLGPTIMALTGSESVPTISQTGALIVVQVEHPRPWTPAASALVRYGEKLTVPIGVNERAKPEVVTFGDGCPVLAYIGPPGSGKSTGIMSTVAILAAQSPASRVRFLVAAKHVAGWNAFVALEHMEEIASDEGAAIDLIRYVAGPVLEDRQRTDAKWPAIFLVADDVTGLILADKTVGSPLTTIATEGRKHQIFLILGLHGAGRKDAVAGMVDESIAHRIVYRPRRSDAGTRNTGRKGSAVGALSERAGDALHISGRTETRVATPIGWEKIVARIAPLQIEDGAERAPRPLRARSSPTRERSGRSTPAPAERGDTNSAHGTLTSTPAPAEPLRSVSPGNIETPAEIGAPREPTTEEREDIVRYIIERTDAGQKTSGRHLIDILYCGRRGRTVQEITKSLLKEAERQRASRAGDPFADEEQPAALPKRLSDSERAAAVVADEERRIREEIEAQTIDWSTVTFKGR